MAPGTSFKDHFSGHAADYARYRPHYPSDLYDWLARISPGQALAIDCATGNGQAAAGLANHFAQVLATDASAQQIAAARSVPGVRFQVAAAHSCPIEDGSADLVTVAQALHWFDLDAFYREVHRVLRPQGVLAVWCYQLAQVDPSIDALVYRYYTDTVGDYWPPERAAVEHAYRGMGPSWPTIDAPAFTMRCEWSVAQMLGYLASWSASRRAADTQGRDPLADLKRELPTLWGEQPRPVRWPLQLRAWRRPTP